VVSGLMAIAERIPEGGEHLRTTNTVDGFWAVASNATPIAARDQLPGDRRAKSRRYLKSVFGCLLCSLTGLSRCVVDALS